MADTVHERLAASDLDIAEPLAYYLKDMALVRVTDPENATSILVSPYDDYDPVFPNPPHIYSNSLDERIQYLGFKNKKIGEYEPAPHPASQLKTAAHEIEKLMPTSDYAEQIRSIRSNVLNFQESELRANAVRVSKILAEHRLFLCGVDENDPAFSTRYWLDENRAPTYAARVIGASIVRVDDQIGYEPVVATKTSTGLLPEGFRISFAGLYSPALDQTLETWSIVEARAAGLVDSKR
jgi:hypothetical protein